MDVVALTEPPLFEALGLVDITVAKPPSELEELGELLAGTKALIVKSRMYKRMQGGLEQVLGGSQNRLCRW